MKKVTLLTTMAIAALGLCGQPLTANAACLNQNGNVIIYSYGSGCDIQDILDSLGNCFPGIQFPENEGPEADIPGTDVPDINIPDADIPETETPDNNGSNDNITEEAPEEDSSTENIHPYIQEIVDLVNAERAKEGLSPLTIDVKVQAAAQVRAKECEQSFSHTRPNGSSFATALTEQNVSYRSAGENIAWGQRSPKEVMSGWMNSAGHRANIMNPNFTTIGVGYYQNAGGTNYWCQLFTR